jgi:mannose-6-phosphate isomerase-like protein (cupin superfamily)
VTSLIDRVNTCHSGSVTDAPIDLSDKLALFSEHWSPKTVAELNDYEIKVVKVKGDFVWHTHEDTDELFLVISGTLTIQLRDGDVTLTPGQLYVVPRGVEHCPRADDEVHALLIEPRGTVNTGDAGGALTAEPDSI